MWKKLFIAAAIAALPSLAIAQTSPNLSQGQKLTPGQWNNLFASKQDTLGFVPLNSAGGVMTGRLVTAAPGASTSGFNLVPGSAPASPANGDLWITSSGFFARVNGATYDVLGATAVSITTGTTTVLSGTDKGLLYDNAGVLGNLATANNGVLVTSGTGVPSISTTLPNGIALGAATATSINKVAFTAPASSATLTIADGKTLSVSNSLTFTGTDGNSFAFPSGSGTVVTTAATQTLSTKTLGSGNVLGGVTMTLGSDATGDIYYRNSGGVLTRLAIGSNTNVLTVSGGLPSWQAGTAAASITAGTTTITGACSTLQIAYSNAGTFACQDISSTLTAGYGMGAITGTNPTFAIALSKQSNPIGGDIAMNNTGLYFDGPTVTQGSTGVWWATGYVTLQDTAGGARFNCKLWDGVTVVASGSGVINAATNTVVMTLTGYFISPAGNIRMSCQDVTSTSGLIKLNASGNNIDSKISAIRIQ